MIGCAPSDCGEQILSESQSVSVILVDDDPDEHFLFQADLEDAGVRFSFAAFTRPEDALVHLRDNGDGPAVVFTDLSLAGANALDFIASVQPLLGGGAVGVYSGARNPEMEAKCRDAGSSFYIVKPVTRENFSGMIAGLGAVCLEEDRETGDLHLRPAGSAAA